MNIPNMIAGLQKSTRITVIACACFLALTAFVLMFLMIFPIEMDKTKTLSVNQTNTEETAATEESAESGQTEAPSTLSDWTASVDGYTRSNDEYNPQQTTAARENTYVTTRENTVRTTEAPAIVSPAEQPADAEPETLDTIQNSNTTPAQTVTEAVSPEPVQTEAPQEQPVQTDPPAAPDEVELEQGQD